MSAEMKYEGLTEKAELIMAVRDYNNEKRRTWERGIDLIVSPAKSDDKILMRVITKSGAVGIGEVREMSEFLERNDYDKGLLFGERFTAAAREEMSQEDIEAVSEEIMPYLEPQRLCLTIRNYVDDLCKARCGRVPEKESDCKGCSKEHYSCKIRLISDNAAFHFERGWTQFLQKDLMRLLAIAKSMSKQPLESSKG